MAHSTWPRSWGNTFDTFASSGTGGAQYYRQDLTLLSATGRTFPSPDVTSIAGAATTFGSDDNIENVTIGVFGQVQLAWKNRFFLTGALRGDDNSAFGSNFDFVTYPKVSASWVLSEEPLWKLGLVDNVRLRAAWGESGQQPQNFAALRTYQPITGQAGQSAITPQFVGNAELGPERSREIELGFDASLLNQRVGIDFTWYNQRTKDAIVLRNVAPSSGFPQQQFVNAGTVQNRGFELLVDGRIIESRTVNWDVGVNLSHNRNDVLELGIPGTPFLGFGFGNRFQPGFPLYAIFARKVVSADKDATGRATPHHHWTLVPAMAAAAPSAARVRPPSIPRGERWSGRPGESNALPWCRDALSLRSARARQAGESTLMPRRPLFFVAALLVAAAPLAAQNARWVVPRTPDGRPDLQGNWTNATLTPIERPQGLGPTLTAEQVAMMEGRRQSLLDSLSQASDPDRPAPPKGGVLTGDRQFDAASGGTGGYNVVYIDGGDRVAVVNGEYRSSLITWPANGRVPMTPAAQSRRAQVFTQFANYDNPENRPLAERCIMSFGSNAGPPMLPNYFYNNNYTIVQTGDHVAILSEMVHDVRIIPIGDRPSAPSAIAPFMGVSSGRWVGDTLVIETTNINPAQATTFFGASAGLRVTERLTRIADRTLLYRFTVEDPESYTEAWSGELPFHQLDDRIYEYACHEGNYALANVLSGARDEARRKAAKPE